MYGHSTARSSPGSGAFAGVNEPSVLGRRHAPVQRATLCSKRAIDVAISCVGIGLLAPLLLLAALAIWIDSPGPVLFSQRRAGRGGKPFRMFKLRTMVRDAESQLRGLVSFEELDEPMFKLRDDPRVTRVGRILRRASIDEIPQLVNVLRGEMSLVGPRPEQVELVQRYTPQERRRLAVKPGITGPMQIYGRAALTFQERLAAELDYIENLSVARDLRILALTLYAVVRGVGAS
jgi:lipopolysaccharide/colanic/teichoic acid biosynthesis glycosyltransferase